MKNRNLIYFVALTFALCIGSLQFISCSQPTNSGSQPTVGITHVVTGTPLHGKKGGNMTLSTDTVDVVNHSSEAFVMRLWIGTDYSDVSVPIGESSTYYFISSSLTGITVNTQSVPSGTPTNVTLPDNSVVRVSWTSSPAANIQVTIVGGG